MHPQKLFGWFGGPGLEGAGQMMDKLELRPARRNAVAAGASETIAGALMALGAFTPLAASLITSTMVTAIRKVHGPKGPWNMQGGYEYNLVLIAAAAALVEAGPGSPSVDRALGTEAKGTKWALAALATWSTPPRRSFHRTTPQPASSERRTAGSPDAPTPRSSHRLMFWGGAEATMTALQISTEERSNAIRRTDHREPRQRREDHLPEDLRRHERRAARVRHRAHS